MPGNDRRRERHRHDNLAQAHARHDTRNPASGTHGPDTTSLAGGARGPAEVAEALVALHATDPATVYLSTAARTGLAPSPTLSWALYEDRCLVRMLGMRRTVFVVPTDLAPVVHAACTRSIAAQERRKLIQLFEQAGVPGQRGRARKLAEGGRGGHRPGPRITR